MANKPISAPPQADLPENWVPTQTVTPAGMPTPAHGFNHLMRNVNAMLGGINVINDAFTSIAELGDDNTVPLAQLPPVYETISAVYTILANAWTRASGYWRTAITVPDAVSAFVDIDQSNATPQTLNAWGAVNLMRLSGTTLELRAYFQPPAADVDIKCVFVRRKA